MMVDGGRIAQVIQNLVSNAVDYAPDGSTVSISCRHTDKQLEFRVSDQGPGIPAEQQALIFEKFRQSTQEGSSNHNGFGLGLAIAKAIVELHGGSIGVLSDSDSETGSTFWFCIPT